jgi:hypothetical protein
MTIDPELHAALLTLIHTELYAQLGPALAPLERRLAWLELRYRLMEGLVACELDVTRDDVQHLVDAQIATLH